VSGGGRTLSDEDVEALADAVARRVVVLLRARRARLREPEASARAWAVSSEKRAEIRANVLRKLAPRDGADGAPSPPSKRARSRDRKKDVR